MTGERGLKEKDWRKKCRRKTTGEGALGREQEEEDWGTRGELEDRRRRTGGLEDDLRRTKAEGLEQKDRMRRSRRTKEDERLEETWWKRIAGG